MSLDRELKKGEQKRELLTLGGPVLTCDVVTCTGRIYPKDVVKKALEEYSKKVENGVALGSVSDDTAKRLGLCSNEKFICSVSHLISKVYMKEDNVFANLTILETDNGKITKAVHNCGLKFRAYCNGMGTIIKNDEGNFVVQDDFKLQSIDLQLVENQKITPPGCFLGQILTAISF